MRSEDALTLILPHPTKENCEEEQEEEEDNSKKAGSGGDKDIRRRTSALRLFKQIDTTKGLSWYKIGLSKQRPFLSFLTLTLIGFTRCSVAYFWVVKCRSFAFSKVLLFSGCLHNVHNDRPPASSGLLSCNT